MSLPILYMQGNGNTNHLAKVAKPLIPWMDLRNEDFNSEGENVYNWVRSKHWEPGSIWYFGYQGGQAILWSVVVQGGLDEAWLQRSIDWHLRTLEYLKEQDQKILIPKPQGTYYFGQDAERRANAEQIETGLHTHYTSVRHMADDLVDLSLSRIDPEQWFTDGVHFSPAAAESLAHRLRERVLAMLIRQWVQ